MSATTLASMFPEMFRFVALAGVSKWVEEEGSSSFSSINALPLSCPRLLFIRDNSIDLSRPWLTVCSQLGSIRQARTTADHQ